jgi:hypothetical protein
MNVLAPKSMMSELSRSAIVSTPYFRFDMLAAQPYTWGQRICALEAFVRLLALVIVALSVVPLVCADDSDHLVRIDHYVPVKSTAPSVPGATTEIYVREVALAGTALRGVAQPDRVVLFIHGAGTPAEVSFDVVYQDYSWMAYLAHAGFDVFAMDMTGYGRSTRPPQMNDPCNLAKAQQTSLIPSLLEAP